MAKPTIYPNGITVPVFRKLEIAVILMICGGVALAPVNMPNPVKPLQNKQTAAGTGMEDMVRIKLLLWLRRRCCPVDELGH